MKELEYARQVTRSQIIRWTAAGLLVFALLCGVVFLASIGGKP